MPILPIKPFSHILQLGMDTFLRRRFLGCRRIRGVIVTGHESEQHQGCQQQDKQSLHQIHLLFLLEGYPPALLSRASEM